MKPAWVVCVCVVLLAGCAKSGAPAPRQANALIVAVPEEPRSLDPLLLQGLVSFEIGELGYSYLTNYDSSGNVVAAVALRVPTTANGDVSAGGRIVTYHLRHGIVWQDGRPLTSRDVVATYRAIVDPNGAVPSRYGYDRIESLRAPDPFTVVVRTEEPFSPIVANFFGGDSNYPILPAGRLTGAGPYVFGTWTRGDRLTVRANPRYYAGKPPIDRIDLRFVPNSSTVLNELTTGEVDATFFADVSRIDELRAIPNHRIVVTPVPYFYALSFNLDDPILKDQTVRRAFALAVDRRVLSEKITRGLYDADTGLRGLFNWAYDARAGNIPHDPGQANRLLARAGWSTGHDGVRVKNGHRLEIQLAFYAGSDIEAKFVPLIAAQERDAGIDVTMKRYSREEYSAVDGPIRQGRYQVGLVNYQSSYDPDVSWFLSCAQRAPNGFNNARFCDPAVDRALARGAASFDRGARLRAYGFVQRQVLAQVPYYFLCQVGEIDVIPTRLRGYERPLLSPFNSVARWRLSIPSRR